MVEHSPKILAREEKAATTRVSQLQQDRPVPNIGQIEL